MSEPGAPPHVDTGRVKLNRGLQLLWLALILAFIVLALSTQWQKLAQYEWTLSFPYLIGAVAAGFLRRFWGGLHWAFLLATVSRTPVRRSFIKNLKVYFVTNLATYLPGSLWYIPWRVKIYRELGISSAHTSISSVVESLMLVISHGIVGLPILFSAMASEDVVDPLLFIGFILVGFAFVQPPLLRFFFRLMKRLLGRRLEEPHFEYRQILTSLGLMIAKAFIAGASHLLLLMSLHPSLAASNYLFVTGAVALAWTVGFITPIAPAGLGVREGLLVWLFTFLVPLPVAMVAAVVSRLVFVAEDIGWAGVAHLVFRPRAELMTSSEKESLTVSGCTDSVNVSR